MVGHQLPDNVINALLNSARVLKRLAEADNRHFQQYKQFTDATGIDRRHISETNTLVEEVCNQFNIFDRETMIELIVDDIDKWLQSDRSEALDHFACLERARLRNLTDEQLRAAYDEIT